MTTEGRWLSHTEPGGRQQSATEATGSVSDRRISLCLDDDDQSLGDTWTEVTVGLHPGAREEIRAQREYATRSSSKMRQSLSNPRGKMKQTKARRHHTARKSRGKMLQTNGTKKFSGCEPRVRGKLKDLTMRLHPGAESGYVYIVCTQRGHIVQYVGSLPCVCYDSRRRMDGLVGRLAIEEGNIVFKKKVTGANSAESKKQSICILTLDGRRSASASGRLGRTCSYCL